MNLITSLYKIGAIKFGQFTLKSGQTSKIYLDLRKIISYPDILRSISDILWEKIQSCHFNLICGVPYTALPIATCISLQHTIPMVMRRKEKKSYGTKQQIEGDFHSGQNCLIIEDVITTGSSIIETADDLKAVGLNITDVAVLINRQQNGTENLQKYGYKLHAVFTLAEIMNELLTVDILSEPEKLIIHELLE